MCGGEILAEAVKCKHCKEWITPEMLQDQTCEDTHQQTSNSLAAVPTCPKCGIVSDAIVKKPGSGVFTAGALLLFVSGLFSIVESFIYEEISTDHWEPIGMGIAMLVVAATVHLYNSKAKVHCPECEANLVFQVDGLPKTEMVNNTDIASTCPRCKTEHVGKPTRVFQLGLAFQALTLLIWFGVILWSVLTGQSSGVKFFGLRIIVVTLIAIGGAIAIIRGWMEYHLICPKCGLAYAPVTGSKQDSSS
jgi:Zn finger protein HypA/HybF involved in hydrogenase expression